MASRDWPVLRLRLFASVVVLATAVWSFSSLHSLARVLGFGALSIIFPLTVDTVIAFGMDVWMRRKPESWRSGRRLAVFGIAVSILGNILDWVLVLSDWRSAVLSAVPPTMMAATLLVLHQHTADRQPGPAASAPDPTPDLTPDLTSPQAMPDRVPPGHPAGDQGGPVAPQSQDRPKRRTRTTARQAAVPAFEIDGERPTDDHGRLDLLRSWYRDHGDLPPRRAVAAALSVGSDKATALLRQVRTEQAA